jgi:uncharacterized protein DUF4383
MEASSPARLYALLVGGVLVIAGVIGFFYAAGFDTGDEICSGEGCDKVFGLLAVNGWHNIVHIATGALGLLAVSYGVGAQRAYAFYLGVVYVIVAILGFIDFGSGDFNDTILKVIPVNTEDNFLHLILGVLGIGAAAATPKAGMPKAAAPASPA